MQDIDTAIKSAFQPAFNEIQRRAAQPSGHDDAISYFQRDLQSNSLPFKIPDQDHVLISLGTRVLAPRSDDPTRPALRVYGAFPTRDEAVDHSTYIRELDDVCSLIIAQRDEWILCPQTNETRDDAEEAARRRDAKLARYHANRNDDIARFKHEVSEKLACPEASVQEVADEEKVQLHPPPRKLRAGAAVQGQGFVALCVVPDEDGEVLIRILGCFEDMSCAETWIRNEGSRNITEFDIVVASTCQWLFPNAVMEGPVFYRIPELQRIMDGAKANVKQVKEYKAWKMEEDAKAKTISSIEEVQDESAQLTSESNTEPVANESHECGGGVSEASESSSSLP